MPVLSDIEPPQIRRDRATLQEYKKAAQQLTYRVPIKEIPRDPPKSQISPTFRDRGYTTRASINQTEQEAWEQSWSEGEPPGNDLVADPTCPQPGLETVYETVRVFQTNNNSICP